MGGCMTLPKMEIEWQRSMYPYHAGMDDYAQQAPKQFDGRHKKRFGGRELIEREGAFHDVDEDNQEEVMANYRQSIVDILKNTQKLYNTHEKMIPQFKQRKYKDEDIYLLQAAVKYISSHYETFFRSSNYNIDKFVTYRKDLGRRGYRAIDIMNDSIGRMNSINPPTFEDVDGRIKNALSCARALAEAYDEAFGVDQDQDNDKNEGEDQDQDEDEANNQDECCDQDQNQENDPEREQEKQKERLSVVQTVEKELIDNEFFTHLKITDDARKVFNRKRFDNQHSIASQPDETQAATNPESNTYQGTLPAKNQRPLLSTRIVNHTEHKILNEQHMERRLAQTLTETKKEREDRRLRAKGFDPDWDKKVTYQYIGSIIRVIYPPEPPIKKMTVYYVRKRALPFWKKYTFRWC